MHYTLLTEKERSAVHHEYRTRAAIVFCFVMAAAGIIGIAGLFPAYTFSLSSERSQGRTLESIDVKDDGKSDATKKELSADSKLLSDVSRYVDGPTYSDVLNGIISAKGPVTFTSLEVEHGSTGAAAKTETSSVTVIIQGVAPTRFALLDLRKRLGSLKSGNIVDLPISELTKSTAVQFSIKVTEQMP